MPSSSAARRRTLTFVAVLFAFAAFGTVASAVISDPPPVGQEVVIFPERDMVEGSGFAPTDRVTVQLLRGGNVVGETLPITPIDEDPAGEFDGIVLVNHPGGACWNGFTPNIVPGDVVRMLRAPDDGIQSTTANVVVTQSAVDDGGTIVVKGTAQDAAGNPLPLEQIEQRIISGSADLFEVNGRRSIRAPGDGTLVSDAPGSINWTATYTGLNAADRERAVTSENRIMWLGRNPLLGQELTIYEHGVQAGPGMPECPAAEGPAASVAPTTLSFGAVATGTTSAAQTVTVTNSGLGVQSALNIGAATLAGANAADYAISSDTCSNASLAIGQSCAVGVTFSPSAAGARVASLELASNAPGSPHGVTLNGAGDAGGAPAASVALEPASLDFGTGVVGTGGAIRSIAVRNTGTADLHVSGLALLGANPGDFSLASDSCVGSAVLPGATCSVGIRFSPTATGARSASLDVASDAAASPHSGALRGLAAANAINEPPAAGREIVVFPKRDMVEGAGFAETDQVTFELIRNGIVVSTAGPATPFDEDGVAPFDGVVLVNHPGGICWNDITPNIRAGDVVRLSTAPGIGDQTTTANVTVTEPAADVGGTIVVKGTAQDALGNPLPIEQVEQRLISGSADLFEANGRRDVRAPGAGTLAYDAPGSINWTATYEGLSLADRERAVASQSRILWLGPTLTEITIYEHGEVDGPAAGMCTAPGEDGATTPPPPPTPPGADTTLPTVSISAPANGATVGGTIDVTADAADNVGVASVQFQLDGVDLGAADTTAPYSVAWDTTAAANGLHGLTAVARDAAGNVASSTAVNVTVDNGPPPDTTLPTASITAPANGATVGGTIAVSADAADNVGVASVQFQLDGVDLGAADTNAPYSVDWNTTGAANGAHSLTAIARDAAGNAAASAAVNVTVFNDATAPTVSMTAPASGSTVAGTIAVSADAADNVGVTSVQFRLDGADLGAADTTAPYSIDWNTTGLADGSSHSLTAIARDAAGNATTATAVTVVVDNRASVLIGGETIQPSTDFNPAGLAEAFRMTAAASGTVTSLSIYVDATSSATRLVAGLYSDAAGRPGTLLGSGSLDFPTAGAFNRVVLGTGAQVTAGAPYWIAILGPSGRGELRFRDRCCGGGSAAETSLSTTLTGLPATWSTGSRFLDGPLSAFGSGGTVVVQPSPDTTAPTVSITAPAGGATVSGLVSVTANATDNTGVSGVQFRLGAATLGSEDTTAPYSTSWDTATVADGSYTLSAVARDAAGNTTTSASVTVTVDNVAEPAPAPAPAPAGLVAAFGFDEGTGTSVLDASGNGNSGIVSGAAWTAAGGGRFGRALSFDGVNDWVTLADSASLDLTGGMTLEAWVRRSAAGDWMTVVMKEQAGGLAYALYGRTDASFSFQPSSHVNIGHDLMANGGSALAVGAWTHLAATYDGSSSRLYVNGALVRTAAGGGPIRTSTGALRIGGNSVWGEWFAGLIDEVRVYNRALSATEIAGDMSRSVSP